MTEAQASGPAASSEVEREATERAIQAAAPTVAPVEVVGSLGAGPRRALYALLSSLADNKYVLGRRYAEWCTGAPRLESAVAAAAMAQDELGHARSFYPLLRGFGMTPHMDDKDWQRASTSAVACLDRPFEHWTDYIAANVLLDTTFTTLLEAA